MALGRLRRDSFPRTSLHTCRGGGVGRLAPSRLLLNASFQCAVFGLVSHGGPDELAINPNHVGIILRQMRIIRKLWTCLRGGASAEMILSDLPISNPRLLARVSLTRHVIDHTVLAPM